MIYPCTFGDIPSFGSRDIVDTRICHADAENLSLWPPVTLKIGSELPNLISSLACPSDVSMQVW